MWNWLKAVGAGRIEPSDRSVLVYTRHGCHLCDEACTLLQSFGLSPQLIDIDADPGLREKYTDCVPVVVIDGKERFRGRINEVLLRRILRHPPNNEEIRP